MHKLDQLLQQKMSNSAHQVVLVGLVACLGFPAFYGLWTEWYPQYYDTLALRLIGSLLGLGLILTPYWPARLRRWLPWYWYGALLYSLPFFFTYLFFMNRASDVSSMSLLCAIFLLVLLVDLPSLLVMLVLGMCSAALAYFLVAGEFYFNQEHVEAVLVLLFVIVAGSTVNYKTTVLQRQRLSGMAAMAGMIAHELRTPLLGIKSGAQALQAQLPQLVAGYEHAVTNGLVDKPMRASRMQQMKGISERMIKETDYANTIIDMILVKAGRDNTLKNCVLSPCSMADCVQEALARYPFQPDSTRDKVNWRGDFQFMGSQLLMQHVLFNLFKNALYAIATAQKGEITLWTGEDDKWAYLYVQDTAKGMSPKQLAHLFDHFYTTTFMGTGIGLSFCKLVMRRFGGDIRCESKEGLYTKFTLSFPRLCL